MKTAWTAASRLAVTGLLLGLLLFGVHRLTAGPIAQQAARAEAAAFREALPGAVRYRREGTPRKAGTVRVLGVFSGYRGGKRIGRVYRIETRGYGGDVVVLVGVSGGRVAGLVVLDAAGETPGLGSRISEEGFRRQFVGRSGPLAFGRGLDAVAGASISSGAVLRAVRAALRLEEGS